ncbi:hypothetical protein CEXT_747141, partial [Caerostris extrusa]
RRKEANHPSDFDAKQTGRVNQRITIYSPFNNSVAQQWPNSGKSFPFSGKFRGRTSGETF